MHVEDCSHVSADACRDYKRALDPPGIGATVVVSGLIWVLLTKSGSSARAVSDLNRGVISPALNS